MEPNVIIPYVKKRWAAGGWREREREGEREISSD